MRSVNAAVKDLNRVPAASCTEKCVSAPSNFMKRSICLIDQRFKGILLPFGSMSLSPVAREPPEMKRYYILGPQTDFDIERMCLNDHAD
jgi:hypothetical protein